MQTAEGDEATEVNGRLEVRVHLVGSEDEVIEESCTDLSVEKIALWMNRFE